MSYVALHAIILFHLLISLSNDAIVHLSLYDRILMNTIASRKRTKMFELFLLLRALNIFLKVAPSGHFRTINYQIMRILGLLTFHSSLVEAMDDYESLHNNYMVTLPLLPVRW